MSKFTIKLDMGCTEAARVVFLLEYMLKKVEAKGACLPHDLENERRPLINHINDIMEQIKCQI